MPALSANVRRAAAQQTLGLPFRVPPQDWFTLRQAGDALGLSESTVEKLYDRGEFLGHKHNAGAGERIHKRIMRASVIAYAIKSADYTDEDFADLYLSPLPHFPAEMLLKIAQRAARLAADKTAPAAAPFFSAAPSGNASRAVSGER